MTDEQTKTTIETIEGATTTAVAPDPSDDYAYSDLPESPSTEPQTEPESAPPVEDEPTTIEQPTTEPAQEPTREPAAPAINDEAVALASQFGIDEQTARSFDNTGALLRTISVIGNDRQRRAEVQQAAKPEEKPKELELTPYELQLPDDVDDDVAEQLRGMNKHYVQQMTKLNDARKGDATSLQEVQTALGHMIEQSTETSRRQSLERFDTACNALVEYKDELGEGTAATLDKNGACWTNRGQVLQKVQVLEQAYRATNGTGTMPPDQQIVKEAAMLVFGDKTTQMVRNKVAEKQRTRQGQFVGKPTSTKTGEPATDEDREKRAIARVAAYKKAAGHDDESSEEAVTF